MESMVLSNTFNDSFLRLPAFERVGFWQSIQNPDAIDITPVYMDNTGALQSPAAHVQQENIVGLIIDKEAAGYTVINQWSAPTPFNARGGFTVNWWHWVDRYVNDFTENAVVLVLD